MTLNKTSLATALQAIGGQSSRSAAAAAWASAVGSYAAGIVPPSTTVSAAQSALQTALASAFAQTPTAAPAMETAFAAFAVSIAGGMTGYTPTVLPASGGIGFATLFGTNRSSASAAATAVANAIDAWLKTGSSTLIAPPNTVVTWS